MSNKLKIEDTCLTVEQSKELQSLGIEMKDTLMVFCDYYDQVHDYELCINWKGATDYVFEAVPTLTNTEMLEIIPQNINVCGRSFMFEIDHYSERYFVTYNCYVGEPDIIETYVSRDAVLLRDSLFEMLKYLKTNKLM